MSRIVVNSVGGGAPRARRRHEEVEDVIANGMAQAVQDADVGRVAELLLRGIRAAALDRCAACGDAAMRGLLRRAADM
jgi:hypothetical protein